MRNNKFLITIIKDDRTKFLNFVSVVKEDIFLDYFIQLFISQDASFREENSIKFPVLQTTELQIFRFDLEDFKNIKNLRLNPLNDSCVINISKIYLILDDDLQMDLKSNIQANVCSHHSDNYFFEFSDPQIYFKDIDFESLSIRKFVIELSYSHIAKDAVHTCTNQITVDKNYEISVLENENLELQTEVEEKTTWAINLDKELNENKEYVQKLQTDLEDKTTWAINLDKELNENKEYVQKLENKSLNLQNELTEIYTSKSWKITQPFRNMSIKIKNLRKG